MCVCVCLKLQGEVDWQSESAVFMDTWCVCVHVCVCVLEVTG